MSYYYDLKSISNIVRALEEAMKTVKNVLGAEEQT